MRQLVEVAANCYETNEPHSIRFQFSFIYIAPNHNSIHLKVIYKDKDPIIIGRNQQSDHPL